MTTVRGDSHRSIESSLRVREPLASVVIPAYNREAYIGEAIDSALAQITDFSYEVIVSDDCSTDSTLDIARSYGDQIRVIAGDRNRGPSENRNRAIRAARGEFIVMLDDDDRMLPGRIQEQIGFLLDHAEVDLALGLHITDDPAFAYHEYFNSKGLDVPWGGWRIFENWRPLLLRRFIGTPSASTYRKSLFDRAGHFDASVLVGDDFEFLVRASQVTPIACFNGPVSWQRVGHTNRLTASPQWSLRSAELVGTLLDTIPNLTEDERASLRERRRRAIRASLGNAFHSSNTADLKEILDSHGQFLPMPDRIKWLAISITPQTVSQYVASKRIPNGCSTAGRAGKQVRLEHEPPRTPGSQNVR